MNDELAGRLTERLMDGASDPVWAQLLPAGHGAMVQGGAHNARPRWTIRLRPRAGIGAGSRLTWRGRTLVVLHQVQDPSRPDRIELLAEELA